MYIKAAPVLGAAADTSWAVGDKHPDLSAHHPGDKLEFAGVVAVVDLRAPVAIGHQKLVVKVPLPKLGAHHVDVPGSVAGQELLLLISFGLGRRSLQNMGHVGYPFLCPLYTKS